MGRYEEGQKHDLAQVNKLNLPDLATSDVTPPTIGPITKQPVKTPGVADPFKKLSAQNTGGGEGGGFNY